MIEEFNNIHKAAHDSIVELSNNKDFIHNALNTFTFISSLYSLDEYQESLRDKIMELIDLMIKYGIIKEINCKGAINSNIQRFLFRTFDYDLTYEDFTITKKLISNGFDINYREGLDLEIDNSTKIDNRMGRDNLYYKLLRIILGKTNHKLKLNDSLYKFLQWLADNGSYTYCNTRGSSSLDNTCLMALEEYHNYKYDDFNYDDKLFSIIIKDSPTNNQYSLLMLLLRHLVPQVFIERYLHLFDLPTEDKDIIDFLTRSKHPKYSKSFRSMLRDKVLGNKIGGRFVS